MRFRRDPLTEVQATVTIGQRADLSGSKRPKQSAASVAEYVTARRLDLLGERNKEFVVANGQRHRRFATKTRRLTGTRRVPPLKSKRRTSAWAPVWLSA